MIEHQPKAADIRLDPGGSADLDQVVAIMESAFDRRFGEAWTRSQCAGILPMPGVALTLARDGGAAPIGFSLTRMVADEAELLLLAVAPAVRRRGTGRLLLDHFLEQARQYGASRVHLEVREGNEAVKLYRSADFSVAGRRRKYYRGSDGSEFDALTLSRAL